MDGAADDPVRLRSEILAALGCFLKAPVPEGADRTEDEFMAALEQLAHPVWLVLDDIHLLREPETVRVLEVLLRRRLPNLHFVLSGRRKPVLSLHRRRLAGELREIGADDLAFSRGEAREALSCQGVSLSAENLSRVMTETEGWPAAVRLAAQALSASHDHAATIARFTATGHAVADYLDREVLSEIPIALHEFLWVMSVCDRFTAELATALTGRADAAEVLDWLESFTSLISRDVVDGTSYRCQTFLRSHLRAETRRRDAAMVAGSHRSAARWFVEHGEPVRAMRHAAEGHNDRLTVSLMTENGLGLVLGGEVSALRRAGAELPAKVAGDPEVALILTLADLVAGEREMAELRLTGVSAYSAVASGGRVHDLDLVVRTHWARLGGRESSALDELMVRIDRITEPELLVLALINRGTALLWLGRHRAAGSDLERALHLATAHGFDYAILHCLSQLSGVAAAESDFPLMARLADRAIYFAEDRKLERSAAVCFAYTIAGWAAYQFLDHDRAREFAPLAVGLLGSADDPAAERCTLSLAEFVSFEWGPDPHAALVRLRGHWAGLSRKEPIQPALIAYEAAIEQRMALRLGRPDWAAEVERRASAQLGDVGDTLLLRARVHAHHGRTGAVRTLLDKITKGDAPCYVVTSLIEAHLLGAALAERTGDPRAANLELKVAIELAEPRWALRPFYEAGPEIRRLLVAQVGRSGHLDPFVDELLAAIAVEPSGVSAELTPREMSLLKELPSLATVDEIAVKLFVSVNTVKTHLRHVYRKFGVTSRRDAVDVARKRGLL